MKIDWHPYPDETPEQKGEYMVTSKYFGEDDPIVSFSYWDSDEQRNIFDDDEVIAWAELPEPYDPSGENE